MEGDTLGERDGIGTDGATRQHARHDLRQGAPVTSTIPSSADRVLWLDEPACADPAQVGGKAARLSILACSYPVSPGFCLPVSLVAAVVTDDDPRARLLDMIAPAYARLAQLANVECPRVAVRSSAVDEDGAGSSFAGQHESYLNLAGDD